MRDSSILRETFFWDVQEQVLARRFVDNDPRKANRTTMTRHTADSNSPLILPVFVTLCLTTTALHTLSADARCGLRIRLARVPASLELTEHRVPAPRSQHARFREARSVTGDMYMQCEQQVERGREFNVQLHADCIDATTATLDDRCFTFCSEDCGQPSPLRSRC